jgi:saccharopepsin
LFVQWNFTYDLVYFTKISIGTPPRPFQVLVDLASPDTFVTSSKCIDCCAGDTRYDPDLSSTSEPTTLSTTLDYGWLLASGNVTNDTFHLGGLKVKSQPFISANFVQPRGVSFDNLCLIHGFLGLTPSSAGSSLHSPSPLMSMAFQSLLDANVFTLRLQEPRSLTFGSIDSTLHTGPISYIPLTNRTSPFSLTGRWQASTEYLTLGSDPGIRFDLSGRTASFGTSTAFMLLPDEYVKTIWDTLGFEDLLFLPPSVPCEKRDILPPLTFNLSGKNFTLSPHDWTMEWVVRGGMRRCVSAMMPMGRPPWESGEIFLGSAFMRAFYSVFDLDRQEIGCEYHPPATD